jgi:hypothetical protein
MFSRLRNISKGKVLEIHMKSFDFIRTVTDKTRYVQGVKRVVKIFEYN